MSQIAVLPAPVAENVCLDPAESGRTCCLCGGNSFSRLHEWPVGDRWNPATTPIAVWQCTCQLALLHPVPTVDQLPAQGDWWANERKKFSRRKTWKVIRTRFNRWLFGRSTDRLVKYTHRAAPGGRLLDIGCGTGELLKAASRYYECHGLDPSPIAAAKVRARGLPVIESTFEDAVIKPRSFDVVTLDSVIEHVHNPVDVLRKVNEILVPGGVVALKTPKFGGPAYRMHGRGWNGFRHGYHTFLFSGDTLRRTLAKAGFETLEHPRRDRPLDDILILWGRKVRENGERE